MVHSRSLGNKKGSSGRRPREKDWPDEEKREISTDCRGEEKVLEGYCRALISPEKKQEKNETYALLQGGGEGGHKGNKFKKK